jgi:hypothetical protein
MWYRVGLFLLINLMVFSVVTFIAGFIWLFINLPLIGIFGLLELLIITMVSGIIHD